MEGDRLAQSLPAISADAFNFPAPLVPLGTSGRLSVLELFHGPTAAFKDFGARFLAASMSRVRQPDDRPLTILVATSGDTGGAVAAAFHGRPGIEVGVLFPQGLVSPTQERQLTCWGGNVKSFAVRGTFDDCQRMVKEAFLDAELRRDTELSSANSINLGRLLPQAVYYAATSLAIWRQYGEPASYIIPSGNLGNAAACIWARKVGLPIGEIVLAHNVNRTVPDYLESGEWKPRPSVPTLASAMDVGNPSNMERLRALFPELRDMRGAVSAFTVTDDAQSAPASRAGFQDYSARSGARTRPPPPRLTSGPAAGRSAADTGRWVLVSTAHPAKFRRNRRAVRLASAVARSRYASRGSSPAPTHCTEIEADLSALARPLGQGENPILEELSNFPPPRG